jgi:hypothetical protein
LGVPGLRLHEGAGVGRPGAVRAHLLDQGSGPRRADAKIGDDVTFHTKPALARAMLERALAAKLPFRSVTGDEVHRQDPVLRGWPAQQHLSYVLAIAYRRSAPPGTAPTACADTPGPWCRCPARATTTPRPAPRRALLIRRGLADRERAY